MMKHRISGKENCTLNHTTNIRDMEIFQTNKRLTLKRQKVSDFLLKKWIKTSQKRDWQVGCSRDQYGSSNAHYQAAFHRPPPANWPLKRPGNTSWVCRMATEIAVHQMKLRTACFAMAAKSERPISQASRDALMRQKRRNPLSITSATAELLRKRH